MALRHVPDDPASAMSCVIRPGELELEQIDCLYCILTSALLRDRFLLRGIDIQQERRQVHSTASLPDLEQLAGTLEQNIDGGVELASLDVSRGECPCFLVGLVRLRRDEG